MTEAEKASEEATEEYESFLDDGPLSAARRRGAASDDNEEEEEMLELISSVLTQRSRRTP